MVEVSQHYKIQELIRQRRMRDIRSYGQHALSYSSLQDGVQEFRHPGFRGFIPYMRVWGVDYVLSNPVVPMADCLVATMLFLDFSPNAVFCQITKPYAALLNHLGFKVNAFGVEHRLDLADFEVTWKKRRGLKRYLSKLTNQNYFVFENLQASAQVRRVSQDWLQRKTNKRELKFLSRPFDDNLNEDMRTFYMIKDKQVIGFCGFDPMYVDEHSEQPSGYALQFLRTSDKVPTSGGGDFLLTSSLLLMKSERIRHVSLGLAPLYERVNSEFQHSGFAEMIFRQLYKSRLFYSFDTLGQHKDRYLTHKLQTYLATPERFTPTRLFGLLKVNNLI